MTVQIILILSIICLILLSVVIYFITENRRFKHHIDVISNENILLIQELHYVRTKLSESENLVKERDLNFDEINDI